MSAIIGSEEIIIQLTPHICIIEGIFYQRGRRGLSVSLSDKNRGAAGSYHDASEFFVFSPPWHGSVSKLFEMQSQK